MPGMVIAHDAARHKHRVDEPPPARPTRGRRHRTDMAGSNPSGLKMPQGSLGSCRCDVSVGLPREPRNFR